VSGDHGGDTPQLGEITSLEGLHGLLPESLVVVGVGLVILLRFEDLVDLGDPRADTNLKKVLNETSITFPSALNTETGSSLGHS
jgi:hypothetical protein